MFWSANFMAVRELNFLLKEENVTLASVLEADDILQECKADNKALIQFLTRPDILAELITLITEEPPKNVELSQQYRHASIACEVLTSHLSSLSDRLTLDTAQMNRLCDFINQDPPLNPLLASYFSKTVEMLLERSSKQDWYLYHIVCLRVLDFFKSRRDFLPNLLRHISTSAIADTFKYLIRLDDLFNKPIMEWLEQHQFIDSLIAIICGSYVPEHFPPPEEPEKGQREPSEKECNDNANQLDNCEVGESSSGSPNRNSAPHEPAEDRGARDASEAREARETRAERAAAVAADNAAALLCDLVATGCAGEGSTTRSRTAWQLSGALGSSACVRGVLCSVFTSAPRRRAAALLHAARLLLQLLHHHTESGAERRSGVELAVAPHLPLLHQALLHAEPADHAAPAGDGGSGAARRRVGAARVAVAALLAQLALSEVEEVASTLLTLGTPGVLVEMMFSYPENNFLHAQVVAFCRNALSNRLYRLQYARHLFMECDLLTKLMDAFEENENTLSELPRAGYMGHVVVLLGWFATTGLELWAGGAAGLELGAGGAADCVRARLARLRDARLERLLHRHDTPLGGSYPSETMYDTGEEMENTMAANYDDDFGRGEPGELDDYYAAEMSNSADGSAQFVADALGLHDPDPMSKAQNSFLELASQRFDDDMWEDTPDAEEAGAARGAAADPGWGVPAWESAPADSAAEAGGAAGGEGWAQFDTFAAPPPAFAAPAPPPDPFGPFWGEPAAAAEPEPGQPGQPEQPAALAARLAALRGLGARAGAELANNLLTAMSGMTPAAIANIVNANLQPLPLPLPGEINLAETTDLPTPNPVTPPAEFSNAPPLPSEPSALHDQPICTNVPDDAPLPEEDTVPKKVTLPNAVILPQEVALPADVTLPKEVTPPKEVTAPAELPLPNEVAKTEVPDSSSSDEQTKLNCVAPVKGITVAPECSGSVPEGEVDDLSRENISGVADTKIDNAIEATEAAEATESAVEAAEVTEVSER